MAAVAMAIPLLGALWPLMALAIALFLTLLSPDLNPIDYHVWGLMQEQVYKNAMRDTADLKQRLIETWSGIPQTH